MITAIALIGANELTETQRSVAEHFREGGSFLSIMLVLAVTAAIVVLAYGLTRRQQRRGCRASQGDPRQLYQHLLKKLDLTTAGRRLLGAIANDLRLKHPTAMLLSPTLFDRYVEQWRAQRRGFGRALAQPQQPESVAEVRAVLFPG